MRATLTVVRDGRTSIHTIEPGRPITLGRSTRNAVVLSDEHASRHHATIEYVSGSWRLTDHNSRNGTHLNGEPVPAKVTVPLTPGHRIVIGATTIDFGKAEEPTGTHGPITVTSAGPESVTAASSAATVLHPDELGALVAFMNKAAATAEATELIRVALDALAQRTGATVAGYLALDPAEPVAKIVWPVHSAVDWHLSREMTRRIAESERPVWLDAGRPVAPSESLGAYQDAIGLAVRVGGPPLAAVHLYKRNGQFGARDVQFAEVLVGHLAYMLAHARERARLTAENRRLRNRSFPSDELIGDSPAVTVLRTEIARAAPLPYTVLITGPTGTGKEIVALEVHRRSSRRSGPFIVVDCSAGDAALEEQLFGADGSLREADEGTLFLDEVAELSWEFQGRLLRVLATKQFRPHGAKADVASDVRVVAASSRSLPTRVQNEEFRLELYHRLKVLQLNVPPLCERPQDIEPLVEHMLSRLPPECRRAAILTPAAYDKLRAYAWPGNVRELHHELVRALVRSTSDRLDAADFTLGEAPAADLPVNLKELLRSFVVPHAMERAGGNKALAAKLIGVTRPTLDRWLKQFGHNGKRPRRPQT
ncbi:MAG: sigma 54-interacting transcriptional regulator [Gemmataceae bacterium]